MARSFNRIDYRLRPAKAVERRMMAEAFLRLFVRLGALRLIDISAWGQYTFPTSLCFTEFAGSTP